ncbi:MAG TPA: A24 family peptidase [Anaerolineaceae bacterium]|nr:A24 family peptidase [Anaerolineaceae bacterium]
MLVILPLMIISGILVGLLANYLSDVLPQTRSLSHPVCQQCKQSFGITDYLLLRPCHHCGAKRSIRSWVVQMFYPLAFIYLTFFSPNRLGVWIGAGLLFYFGLVIIMDLEHRLILNPISMAGALIGVCTGFYMHGWESTLLGGVAGFGIMWVLFLLGELYLRFLSKKRREVIEEVALGFGDVNLGGVLGLILGWPGITAGLLFAILIGGLVSGGYLIYTMLNKHYRPNTAIPYAPFLILGAILLLYRP